MPIFCFSFLKTSSTRSAAQIKAKSGEIAKDSEAFIKKVSGEGNTTYPCHKYGNIVEMSDGKQKEPLRKASKTRLGLRRSMGVFQTPFKLPVKSAEREE